jgi:alpha-beta hydrolase superfamily lysophospholipase
VHYGLFEDSLKFAASPDFKQPALIFHGVADTVVPIDHSRAFAVSHPNVRLTVLDSDHELVNSLPLITDSGTSFLTGAGTSFLKGTPRDRA